MHLLVPFASALSEAAVHTLRDLQLPRLQKLLTLLAPAARCGDDEYTLTPPHERALAEALGLRGEDGRIPWGARQARLDGIDVGAQAGALMTPVHWAGGREQVTRVDPATLALSEAESRAAMRREADRRGLFLSDEVMGYLLTHFERDMKHLMAMLDRLDTFSLASKRAITVPLLKQMLAEEDT